MYLYRLRRFYDSFRLATDYTTGGMKGWANTVASRSTVSVTIA